MIVGLTLALPKLIAVRAPQLEPAPRILGTGELRAAEQV
jgi:hypothetical protein